MQSLISNTNWIIIIISSFPTKISKSQIIDKDDCMFQKFKILHVRCKLYMLTLSRS